MPINKHYVRALTVASLTCALAGCAVSTSDTSLVSTTSPVAASPSLGRSLDVLRAKRYDSFGQLRSDSVAAVVVTAGQSRVQQVVGGAGESVPETITTVAVESTPWGKAPASSLQIVQLGDTTYDTSESGALLQSGRRYLLFVTPSRTAGTYSITGSVSGFVSDGNSFRRTTDDVGSQLPQTIAVADLDHAVNA